MTKFLRIIVTWFLGLFEYEVNKWENEGVLTHLIDIFLIIGYSAISIYNAFISVHEITLIESENQEVSIELFNSALLIIVNLILLLRINVKLCISRDRKKKVILNKCEKFASANLKNINIESINRRLRVLYAVYIIDMVISVFLMMFGLVVLQSIVIVVILSTAITMLEDILDHVVEMCNAQPAVYKKELFSKGI